ncbi:MAG TPA: G1 family glutamic endopeptidase, partial [Solirubrobacteraceae bacterium]|nr:G1 family glutamic endopeptidase [Solirubrobacteraceae bacterium]
MAATGNRVAHAAGGPMLRAPSLAQRSLAQTSQAGIAQTYAYNWSGYAQSAEGAAFYAVTDTWTVPTVDTSLPGIQFSSDWVGIGG